MTDIIAAAWKLVDAVASDESRHGGLLTPSTRRAGDELRRALSGLGYYEHGKPFEIAHDGFKGVMIGHYIRLDGYRGVVGQHEGTKMVHVYGAKWLDQKKGDDDEGR